MTAKPRHHAAVLAIGSELTAGRVLDTNSRDIARKLAALGIACRYHISCPDDMDLILRALAAASAEAGLVIVTGGLGPTADDITRDAIARALGQGLSLHQPSLDAIQARFEKFGIPMPESNRRQAMFPEQAEVIDNAAGTAPGFSITDPAGETLIISLPGVPREIRAMWSLEVEPRLRAFLGDEARCFAQRALRTCGIAESKLDKLLEGIEAEGLEVSFNVKEAEGTVLLTFTAGAVEAEEARALASAAFDEACARLGDGVCAVDAQTLPESLISVLQERGASLAIVEGQTAGRLTALLTSAAEAEEFLLSVEVMASTALRDQRALALDVDPSDPELWARRAAEDARARSGADYGLALFGPDPARDNIVACAVAGGGETRSRQRNLSGFGHARERNAIWVSAYALDMLRRALISG